MIQSSRKKYPKIILWSQLMKSRKTFKIKSNDNMSERLATTYCLYFFSLDTH